MRARISKSSSGSFERSSSGPLQVGIQPGLMARSPRLIASPALLTGRTAFPLLQTKLTVNRPGDKYEQEADRVADQVMRISDSETTLDRGEPSTSETASIQRACSACEEELQRQPLEEEEELVQAKEVSAGAPQLTAQFATAVSGMRGGGRPLSPSLRAYFEPRFGHDFSRVRVHTEGRSNETARAIHARAYTIGQDVVFGSGEYLPFATEGKRLIAHELAHVVQQDRVSTAKSPDWTSDTRSSPVRRPVSTNALSSTPYPADKRHTASERA